jgi:glycosidase
MHWRLGPSAGFTTGTPWEPLQPDSLTANVEAQEADPVSLLNHHRRLVHVRMANPALARGDGEFIPLTASEGAAMAYLRREGEQTVLVLLNLGGRRLSRVRLSSDESVLPAGRYAARSLFGGRSPAALRVATEGRINGWVPLPALEPFETHIIELPTTR